MKILTHTPLILSPKGFLRTGSGKLYISSSIVTDAIASSFVYYYIKKDYEIKSIVSKHLLEDKLCLNEIGTRVKDMIFKKYNLGRIFYTVGDSLPADGRIYRTLVNVFDLKKKEEVDSFSVEVFEGVIDISIDEEFTDLIRPASHSFVEAVLRMEKELLEDHPLVSSFYNPMLNEIKKWDIPLRLGLWTKDGFRGDLLFFWKVKDIRERILKEFKVDVRPSRILILPLEGVSAGWGELRRKEV